MVNIESKRKDKILTKKNFVIQGLMEKIELLERSNASLFKELDQSIQGVSIIQNNTQLEIIEEYLNGEEQHEEDSKIS